MPSLLAQPGPLLLHALAWLPMVPLAILNAAAREKLYGPHMRELRAHQLSTVTAIALFAVYIGLLARWTPLPTLTHAIAVGVLWVLFTMLFEFGFGHFIAKQPWSRMLHDYNLAAGRVWLLLLLWLGAAPAVFHTLS
jgi:hypothetical protein